MKGTLNTVRRLTLLCAGIGLTFAAGIAAAAPVESTTASAPADGLAARGEAAATGLDWNGFTREAGLGPVIEQRRGNQRRGRAVAHPRAVRRVPAQPLRRGGRTIVRGGVYYPYYPYSRYSPYYPYGYWGYGYGYPGYWGGSYWGAQVAYGPRYYTGAIRLKIKPKEAQVFVDGYYVGLVDEFDGVFQELKLEPGPKRIEVRAEGFETLTLEVRILPGQTIKYEAGLRPGTPGPPPQPTAPPPARGMAMPQQIPDPRAEEPAQADEFPEAGEFPAPYPEAAPPFVAYGGVRLEIEPRSAQVYADGYYVGTVDDFDGGRGLPLESGIRKIEVRADGFEPLVIELRILPEQTITYEEELTPLPDGDRE